MSNLVRQRRAHDLWISKNHLYAYGLSAGLAVIAAFGGGYVAGRASVEAPVSVRGSITADASRQELVELLARVDAAATPDGGVRDLTFPDALTGELPPGDVPVVAVDEQTVRLEGHTDVVPDRGDVPPHGRWTVAAASVEDRAEAEQLAEMLRERELEAWVAPEQLDGQTLWRVGVGGWGSKSEAEEALPGLLFSVAVDGHTPIVARF